MNVVAVKDIIDKYTKAGKRKDGKAWKKTCFVGIVDEGEERIISTFSHVETGKTYEMELEDEDYEGKTYWKATKVGAEFGTTETKQTEKASLLPKQQPTQQNGQTPPPNLESRISALKCSLIYYDKADRGISADDVLATAQRFYEWLKQ